MGKSYWVAKTNRAKGVLKCFAKRRTTALFENIIGLQNVVL